MNLQATNSYSHRAIWAIALPMMLSAISAPLVGLVDTAVMGHMDSPIYLAAVAANVTIFSAVFLGLNFLRMGTTGITAQAFGSGSAARITESLVQPTVIALVMALLLLIMQAPLREVALWLIAPETQTGELARVYFDIRIWSAPAVLLNYVMIGWLLGMQNARGPLAIMLAINITNALLDLWFVLGLNMTVDGVALASALAELAGIAVGVCFVHAELQNHKPAWQLQHYRELQRYLPLFAVNGNLFVRSMALMFTLAFITAQGARLGNLYLAANALLMNFIFFMAYALDGIAHAAEALTGRAVGARDNSGLQIAVNRTMFWTAIFAAIFSGIFWMFGKDFIYLLSDIADIRSTAITYLPWLVAAPLFSAWCYLYDGVYVGITRAREMRIVMVVAALLVFLPVWWLTQSWGNHALWLALMLFFASRGIMMHVWYRRLLLSNRLLGG